MDKTWIKTGLGITEVAHLSDEWNFIYNGFNHLARATKNLLRKVQCPSRHVLGFGELRGISADLGQRR
ncbi:hypothetical protein HPP92_017000 [Vanilla planifolia]|uniref:Uncharacterized protein n=1 Tax=Vanilla planifolia TaxID=51239 RepID=A0A835QMI4_VANPL|nr:hypothetical protein HPP92_017000 [Vanilla planifolia]